METNPAQSVTPQQVPTEQVLAEILENTRKTKNYMKWSLYITVILVVLPLLAALFIVPFVFSSLSSTYGNLLQ